MPSPIRNSSVAYKPPDLSDALAVIPGGVNSSLRRLSPPITVTKARGAYFEDADGKRYLDYHAAFGPPILGYADPKVIAAVSGVMKEFDNVGVGVSNLEVQLASRLITHIPSTEKVLLCNSGSDATYHAIRLSRAVTGRKKVMKFQGCYHGFHDAVAMNVITPEEKLGTVDSLSAGSLPETQANTIICDFNDLDQVEDSIKANRGEIAAIILEPVAHNIGCVLPRPGFLEGLRQLTLQHGIILIFDEVITGFRHGLGGYQKIAGVNPDLTTFGKAMANGHPIAAVGGRAELMDHFNTHRDGNVFFAGTYNGHPTPCAAALATIEVLEDPHTYVHLFRLGDRIRSGITEIMTRHGIRATIAGYGSVFVTYFMEGPITSYSDLLRNDAEFFLEYRRRLVSKGIFELPMNLKRAHISLSHTDQDIDLSLQACEDVIREMKKTR
jgi:glutamate-1-semialdehyde 2,1-aminomutase